MIYYLAAFFEIVVFVTFLVVYKNNRDTVLKYLGWFLLFSFIIDILSFLLFSYFKNPQVAVSNLSLMVESFVISYVFYNLTPKKNKTKFKKILQVSSSLIFFLFVYIVLFLRPYSEWNYRLRAIAGIYFAILACYYLYRESISDDLEEFLIKKSGFWFAASILIYHTGTSIVFSLHHFTTRNNIFLGGIPLHRFFSAVLSILSDIFLFIAIILWKKPFDKQQS